MQHSQNPSSPNRTDSELTDTRMTVAIAGASGLVGTALAERLQDAGHRPLALVGGATGLIGDPKSSGERSLNAAETVTAWSQRIESQLRHFLDFDDSASNRAAMVNNYSWTEGLGAIELLRDIGKHFSVNRMLDREAVRARLEGSGISYTEFSYQLLQAYDYVRLHLDHGCMLQTGGSDQWGNITAGVDLVRRMTGDSVHALTTPLLEKADGTKFGKTESGTVWLDPDLTPPYAFYQFWVNADDRDVAQYLKVFSLRPRAEIEELLTSSQERPHARLAQVALAEELTSLVHGEAACLAVQTASQALFGRQELQDQDPGALSAALREAGERTVARAELDAGLPVVDLLAASELVAGKGAARRMIKEGGAYLNNERITDETRVVTADDLLNDEWLVVRRGRKNFVGVHVV